MRAAVDKALAAGIPIVNVNSETKSAPTAFVGSRDEESARLAMEYIAKRLGGKGAVVMMHGYMGQAAQIKRDAGAREVLAKNPGLHLLAVRRHADREAGRFRKPYRKPFGEALRDVLDNNYWNMEILGKFR